MNSRVLAILLIALQPHLSTAQAVKKALPVFKDFPATETWSGTHADVQLNTPAERLFRTNFRQASKQSPNFAGHFRIATWGCGTQCIQGGMVDLETGNISPLPTGGKNGGERFWDVCYSAYLPSIPIDHRVDSTLLIIRCADFTGRDGGVYIRTAYYVYKDGSFTKIRTSIGRERLS